MEKLGAQRGKAKTKRNKKPTASKALKGVGFQLAQDPWEPRTLFPYQMEEKMEKTTEHLGQVLPRFDRCQLWGSPHTFECLCFCRNRSICRLL